MYSMFCNITDCWRPKINTHKSGDFEVSCGKGVKNLTNKTQPTKCITVKGAKTVHLEIIIRDEKKGEF